MMTHLNRTTKNAAVPVAALACAMAMFLTMTACSTAPGVSSETAAAPSATAAASEPTAENTASPSPVEASAPQEVQPISASVLTLEDAKAAALEDAGFAETDVTVQKTVQEYENGISVYDIEFLAGDVEYDYEINTDTGEIYSKKVEIRRGGIAETDPSAAQITEENAKSIALEHAGLIETDVTFTKTKLDMDDGLEVYEIEFRQGSKEYEYEIHSQTGEIVKSHMERQ